MLLALSAVALACYALTLWPLSQGILQHQPVNKKQILFFGFSGSLCHLAVALLSIFGGPLADLSLFTTGSLIFSVAVMLVLFSSLRHPLHSMLLVILPIAVFLIAATMLTEPTKMASLPAGTAIHVVFSVLAYGVITIAASCALVLYYGNYLLKHKKIGRKLQLLPPLETIDKLLFEMILAGEVLLTLSIMSGLIFVDDFLAQRLPHKTFFSLLSWSIFGFLIVGHYKFGWRGAKAIKWTLAGFTALLLAYVGSKFVIEWILG